MALLVLRSVGLCFGQNQMCHLCGWLKLFLKNVRWEKIKIQKRWLLGLLSDGSFVQSLVYVLFCRSFLHCRLLGLQVTRICPQPKIKFSPDSQGLSVAFSQMFIAASQTCAFYMFVPKKSKGLWIWTSFSLATCRYRSVVLMSK